jgi:deoxyribose-phosphate aldolase
MYIDFAIIDADLDEKKAKEQISEVVICGVNSITIPYYLIKPCKNLVNLNIHDLSCFIDFPLGISDTKTRRFAVEQAILAGVNSVDIAMPQSLATNRKYDKIREDIKNIKEVCEEKGVKIKYILEYRIFDHKCLKKICEIFDSSEIQYIYPSTGFFLDNLADNLIASSFLHQNSKELNIVCSGDCWLDKHFDMIYRSGIHGFRTFSPHIVKNFKKFTNG